MTRDKRFQGEFDVRVQCGVAAPVAPIPVACKGPLVADLLRDVWRDQENIIVKFMQDLIRRLATTLPPR